ncbi:hypothetical protein BSF40_08040 [Pseudomonas sp. ACN5]|nr:hypothetical protein BSF40_08040 [Pseudomonas sp. ACN5]
MFDGKKKVLRLNAGEVRLHRTKALEDYGCRFVSLHINLR